MEETQFVDGLFYNEPRENAPDFILGSLSFSKDRFLTWLDQQEADEKGYVKVDVKRSKEGKIYCQKNTWKPQR